MDEICKAVIENYLGSDRFNGTPMQHLWERTVVISLIEKGMIEIVGPGIFPNPHIKPFYNISIERQLEEFNKNSS